jgi:hypothetical protein
LSRNLRDQFQLTDLWSRHTEFYMHLFCSLNWSSQPFLRAFLTIATATGLCNYSASQVPVITAYAEPYYSFDFANPSNHQRLPFAYNYNRHNEFNLNLGLIQATHTDSSLRASLGLMTGTYAAENLAGEPVVLRNIYEARVGVKISHKHNLWVDAGIFPSHIGFESAIGKDCWNLTRSILADNSPYYESGVKLTYTTSGDQWLISALILNGWQKIARDDGNTTPAFGHQIRYTPDKNLTINSSSFIGNIFPDGQRRWRYFHNLYAIFTLTKRLALTGGFDCGMQQQSIHSRAYHYWYSPILIARYKIGQKLCISSRAEYYHDPDQVIIITNARNGFRTMGYSANLDIQCSERAVWRIEYRRLMSSDREFLTDDGATRENQFMTTSLAISF